MKKSRLALLGAVLKSKVQAFFGWPLVVFAVIGTLIELTSEAPDPEGIVVGSVFLVCGGFLLFCSFRTKRMVAKFRLYVSILSNQSSMSVYELAMALGESEQQVTKALQAMIDRHFFVSAYIDRGRRYLVFPLMEQQAREEQAEEEAQPHVVVACSVCGGDNRIPLGKRCNCMYCDNLIKG